MDKQGAAVQRWRALCQDVGRPLAVAGGMPHKPWTSRTSLEHVVRPMSAPGVVVVSARAPPPRNIDVVGSHVQRPHTPPGVQGWRRKTWCV